MAKAQPQVDPLRARLIELSDELSERIARLRDFGMVFGNAWLAAGELRAINTIVGELEMVIEQIKQDDEPTD